MKTAFYIVAISFAGVLATALGASIAGAQHETPPWTSRDRVMRTLDVDTSRAMTALETTITEFFDTKESQAAFIAAFEANLFPPKTGADRVRVLDDLKDRVERDLGKDSPVLVFITAERAAVEAAVREEEARRVESLQDTLAAPAQE